jgi:hypothetical protein
VHAAVCVRMPLSPCAVPKRGTVDFSGACRALCQAGDALHQRGPAGRPHRSVRRILTPHPHTHIHIHAATNTSADTPIHSTVLLAHMLARTLAPWHLFSPPHTTCIYVCVSAYIYIYVCACVYVSVCMCVCACVCVCCMLSWVRACVYVWIRVRWTGPAGEQLGDLDRQRLQALEAARLVRFFMEFYTGTLSRIFTDETQTHQVRTNAHSPSRTLAHAYTL